jgi:hypothetical protein
MIKNLNTKNLIESRQSKPRLALQEIKINQTNENLSPNNSPEAMSINKIIKNNIQLNNFPSSTKNSLKKTNTIGLISQVPFSTKNSENVVEKKIMRVSTINNLQKKKLEKNTKIAKDDYKYANLTKVKISHKKFGMIEAYSAMTTEGLYR